MRSAAVLFWLLFPATLTKAQDFQIWNEVDLTATWGKIDFLMPLLTRIDTSLPNPQLAATGIIADLTLAKHLTVTGGYLFADLPQRSLLVHIPLIALSTGFQAGRFTIADRNRFEKLIGYPTSPVRYRNRVGLDREFGAHNRWHLFVNDEIFFNLSASRWNQNRFQAGGGARLNRRLFLDIYYLQRNAAAGAPEARVLGTTLRVALTPRQTRD